MAFFSNSSSWDSHKTVNWEISSGGTTSIGAIIFGEAKAIEFTNLELKMSKTLILLSAGAGAKLEAKLPAGSLIGKALTLGSWVKTGTDVVGNPLSISPPMQLTAHRPFALNELGFAKAAGMSAGADAGVVGTSMAGLTFFKHNFEKLFSIVGVELQAILGAGINIASYQGGFLIDLSPTPLSAEDQREIQDIKKRMPDHMHRAHPGKI